MKVFLTLVSLVSCCFLFGCKGCTEVTPTPTPEPTVQPTPDTPDAPTPDVPVPTVQPTPDVPAPTVEPTPEVKPVPEKEKDKK